MMAFFEELEKIAGFFGGKQPLKTGTFNRTVKAMGAGSALPGGAPTAKKIPSFMSPKMTGSEKGIASGVSASGGSGPKSLTAGGAGWVINKVRKASATNAGSRGFSKLPAQPSPFKSATGGMSMPLSQTPR